MRVYILGAPETGKQELAAAVRALAPHMRISSTPQDEDGPALGFMADYRVEMMLAVDRMRDSLMKDDLIYTGSLFDSVAYSASNFINNRDIHNESEIARDLMVAHIIAAMLRDSLRHDFVFFKAGHSDEYGYQIEEALKAVLEEFGVSYVELGSDLADNAELIAGLIHGREVGTRDDIQESDGNS